MRTLLFTGAVLVGLAVASHAAGVTVTAPAPRPMNPWDISTWRFQAGPGPDHIEGRPGYGATASGGYGAVVAPPAR